MGIQPLLSGYLYDTCGFSSMFEWVQASLDVVTQIMERQSSIMAGYVMSARTIWLIISQAATGSAIQSSTADEYLVLHDGAVTVLYI